MPNSSSALLEYLHTMKIPDYRAGAAFHRPRRLGRLNRAHSVFMRVLYLKFGRERRGSCCVKSQNCLFISWRCFTDAREGFIRMIPKKGVQKTCTVTLKPAIIKSPKPSARNAQAFLNSIPRFLMTALDICFLPSDTRARSCPSLFPARQQSILARQWFHKKTA